MRNNSNDALILEVKLVAVVGHAFVGLRVAEVARASKAAGRVFFESGLGE